MTIPGQAPDASDSQPRQELLLTDFTSSSSDLDWYVVNDNVMGGRSEGNFAQEQGELSFAGRTNTNGGGFSSIRTKPLQLDLSGHDGIQLRVKGDGRRYTWRLTTTASWQRHMEYGQHSLLQLHSQGSGQSAGRTRARSRTDHGHGLDDL